MHLRTRNWEVDRKEVLEAVVPDSTDTHRIPSYETVCENAREIYNSMLKVGICPEQARMVLPQSMMTEWYWTGSLMAFARVCNLRCKPDVQKETRDVCDKISEHCNKEFPVSWKYLIDKK